MFLWMSDAIATSRRPSSNNWAPFTQNRWRRTMHVMSDNCIPTGANGRLWAGRQSLGPLQLVLVLAIIMLMAGRPSLRPLQLALTIIILSSRGVRVVRESLQYVISRSGDFGVSGTSLSERLRVPRRPRVHQRLRVWCLPSPSSVNVASTVHVTIVLVWISATYLRAALSWETCAHDFSAGKP